MKRRYVYASDILFVSAFLLWAAWKFKDWVMER
jgi:hypothetical protein